MIQREKIVKELNQAYSTAPKGETACTVHLFGIKHGESLRGYGSLKKIAEDAGIPASYAVEINKGINLARHVRLK